MTQQEFRTEQMLKELLQGIMRPIDTAEIAREAARVAIMCYRDEMAKVDGKRLLTKSQAEDVYGRSVIDTLIRRGLLRTMRLDQAKVTAEDGETYFKPKGNAYLKTSEIEAAIEAANITKIRFR